MKRLGRNLHKVVCEDRRATQIFVIGDTLVRHCGETLTPETIDKIRAEVYRRLAKGCF